jgi:hypothetical protein
MRPRTKTLLILYLVVWTGAVAYVGATLVNVLLPGDVGPFPGEGEVFKTLPKMAPIFAIPIASYRAITLLRNKGPDASFLRRYFLITPAIIYLAMLVVISLMTFYVAPITFMVGLFLGLPGLAVGTLIHCLGAAPILLFQRRLLAEK